MQVHMNIAMAVIGGSCVVGGAAQGAQGGAVLTPTNLRGGDRADPAGIDVQRPRLSWVLKSDRPAERGQTQSAYHILVASSRDKLNSDQGDLWDSGKVQSDQTIQIA